MYYIPSLNSNIVSLGQLEEHGCKVTMEAGYLRIFNTQRRLLARVKRTKNQLYILSIDPVELACLMAVMREDP